ncbi:uncharacterized protein [Rutidosis leptorrhynchoides]|uniref:uncharacterized protein n=1 Tax=Rutidosis leptorrhynchoides TaxID=125765 RepID=UPI003A99DD6C
MIVLSLNIRGCKKRRKQLWVKELCVKNKVQFVGIQESKMSRLELFRLNTMWGNPNFDYAVSLARGRSGGLISIWDPSIFRKLQIWCDDWFIIVKGKWTNIEDDMYLVNIYSPLSLGDKQVLWNRLSNFMNDNVGAYIFMGDFNEVRCEDDRFGCIFNEGAAAAFNEFIREANVHDMAMSGRRYTWMNKSGSKMSRIDRMFVSQNMLEFFPDVKMIALNRAWSDHVPLLLYVDQSDFGPIPFKVFSSWMNREGFNSFVDSTWKSEEIRDVDFVNKLRYLKSKLKVWIKVRRAVESSRHVGLKARLNVIEVLMDNNCASLEELDERTNIINEINEIGRMEESDIRQKARIKWDVEGDENSKFFHAILKNKR